MDSTLKEMLENGASRRLVITFPDNQSLHDLTEEVEEKSVSFSHILCGGKDLDLGANPSQFQFAAHGIGDIKGEHIRAYWNVVESGTRRGLSVDNGTVDYDFETGQITVVPETSGSCSVKIETGRLLPMRKINLKIQKSYDGNNASRRLVMKYYWEDSADAPYSNPYPVTWAASEPTYNISNSVLYITSGSTTEQRIQGADYAYGEITITMPNCVAGTPYTLNVQMAVDDYDVAPLIASDLPDDHEYGEPVYIFDGYVDSADIQPDRESRKVSAYDVLKKAQDIDVSDWWRNQFQPTVKSEYKGAYSTSTTYSYLDVFTYEDVYYKWLVRSTDYVMVNDEPVLASTVLNGMAMADILFNYPFYVQALTDYDIYQYRNKAVSAMYQNLVQSILGTGYEGEASVNALMTVKYSPVSNMKASDFLKYYAQISGAFICVNPANGNLYLQRLGTELVTYSNNFEALKSNYAEYTVPAIGKVQLVGTDGVIYGEYGAGDNAYQIQSPLITDRVANTQARYVYDVVHNYTYVPAEIQAGFSLPIKPGARIMIRTQAGETISTYALENSMSGIQMVEQRLSSKGSESREVKTYTPLQEYINRKQAEEIEKARQQAQRAEAEARNAEANSATRTAEKSGLYTTKVPVTGGGYVFYLHDQEALADSQIRIEVSGSAIRFSTDGGQTYTTELKIDGETITQILSAVGVNAEWINAGTLTAMVLQGVKGEIGNWTIEDYALFSEFVSAVQGIDYKVVLRAPATSLYERNGVSADNGTVSVDGETGQITAVPSRNGSCSIKIKTNKLLAMRKINLRVQKSYNNNDATRRLVMKYYWDDFREAPYSNPYSVTWASSEPNSNFSNVNLYITSGSTTEQRIQGADYAYGEITLIMPNCTAGTPYTLDVQMSVDDKAIETWVADNLPDGFDHDMVLAIYDETNGEIAYALRGNGEVYARKGTFDFIGISEGDNGETAQIGRNSFRLGNGYKLDFDEFKVYWEEDVETDGGGNNVYKEKLIIKPLHSDLSNQKWIFDLTETYTDLLRGRIGNTLNVSDGRMQTDEDGDGRSVWLDENSPGEVFIGDDSQNGKRARIRYGEDKNGNEGLVIDGGDYNKDVPLYVQGTVRETESASIAYRSAFLTLSGEARRSGNMCWFCFDVSSPFGTAGLYHGQDVQVATITNQEDFPLAEVVVPINTDRSDFGDQAYARVNTSGEVYVHQCGNTNGAYASLNLFWLCA